MKSRSFGLYKHWRLWAAGPAAGMLGLVCMPSAQAQQDVVASPPELRDFKLDPDKPAQPLPPASEAPPTTPSAPSSAAPPPAPSRNSPNPQNPPRTAPRSGTGASPVLTVPDIVAERPKRKNAAAAAPIEEKPSGEAIERPETPTGKAQDDAASSTSAAEAAIITDAVNPPEQAPVTNQLPAAEGTHPAWPLWQILLVLIIATASIFVLIWTFRRKRQSVAYSSGERATAWVWEPKTKPEPSLPQAAPLTDPTPAPAPVPPAPMIANVLQPLKRAPVKPKLQIPDFLLPEPREKPTARSDNAWKPKTLPVPPPAPTLQASFAPLRATISIANLTIKGALNVSNIGDTLAQAVTLRTRIISASEEQDQHIAAFHDDQSSMADQLGDTVAGENIDMEIDLTIPLRELKTYALKERKLFVPIVLVNLEYGSSDARQQLQLSCMIGREASPPKPKMGPLRLDLGPRSFAPLGQRPLLG